jgi:hypothetical protein
MIALLFALAGMILLLLHFASGHSLGKWDFGALALVFIFALAAQFPRQFWSWLRRFKWPFTGGR